MTKSSILNNDCWELVIHNLANNPRALFNLLLVSRQLLYLVLPILYRRPFHLKTQSPWPHTLGKSTAKLENLIHLSSKFSTMTMSTSPTSPTTTSSSSSSSSTTSSGSTRRSRAMSTSKNRLSTLVKPTKPPTTVNYSSLIQEMPCNMMTLEKHNIFNSKYLQTYAEKMTVLMMDSTHMTNIVYLAPRFKALRALILWVSSISMEMSEEDLERTIEFVKAHDIIFPGRLQKIYLPVTWSESRAFIRLQNALERVHEMEITMAEKGMDFESLPADHLKTLVLHSVGFDKPAQVDLVEAFLKRCQSLETLTVKCVCLRQGLEWALVDEQKLKIYRKDSRPKSLIPIKNLKITGREYLLKDGIEIFGSTLVKLEFEYYAVGIVVGKRPEWQSICMPCLETVVINGYSFDLKFLSTFECPSLRHLTASWPQHTIDTWKAAKTLRTLCLQQQAGESVDLSSIGNLINLESLELDCSLNHVYDAKEVLDTSQWWFPVLQKATLRGRPADLIQGRILATSPKLEVLELAFTDDTTIDVNFVSFFQNFDSRTKFECFDTGIRVFDGYKEVYSGCNNNKRAKGSVYPVLESLTIRHRRGVDPLDFEFLLAMLLLEEPEFSDRWKQEREQRLEQNFEEWQKKLVQVYEVYFKTKDQRLELGRQLNEKQAMGEEEFVLLREQQQLKNRQLIFEERKMEQQIRELQHLVLLNTISPVSPHLYRRFYPKFQPQVEQQQQRRSLAMFPNLRNLELDIAECPYSIVPAILDVMSAPSMRRLVLQDLYREEPQKSPETIYNTLGSLRHFDFRNMDGGVVELREGTRLDLDPRMEKSCVLVNNGRHFWIPPTSASMVNSLVSRVKSWVL